MHTIFRARFLYFFPSRLLRYSTLVFFAMFLALPSVGHAAIVSLSPPTGTFTVGDTFRVGLYLDTEGKSVNALDIRLRFSSSQLQVTSPVTGESLVRVWVDQPSFNNRDGTVQFQGGIPGGITTSHGLIATITFRVKNVGNSIVEFLPDTKVLLNDGLATNDLRKIQSGVYVLTLPPPLGPIVASDTHPDQSRWYSVNQISFHWGTYEDVRGYSYVLDQSPATIPDDIVDVGPDHPSVTYNRVTDGIHYFHLKAYRDGVWGGVTTYAVKIDSTPPAEFPIHVIPEARTTSKRPVVTFVTTDANSGIDHYEIKIVPLQKETSGDTQPFFVEAESPYILPAFDYGRYDVIVRVYDLAGNIREVTERIEIVPVLFQFVSEKGLEVNNTLTVPWIWVWLGTLIILVLLGWAAWRLKRLYAHYHHAITNKVLPSELEQQLEELKTYRKRYGKILLLFLALGSMVWGGRYVRAATVALNPPFITTLSRSISDTEIFYVGGRTDRPKAEVLIYFQNLKSGETSSAEVSSDEKGDWFYRHSGFLSSGNYVLWTQARVNDEVSPPSAQLEMQVRETAIQLGASRISYETLYLIILILLAFAVIGLICFIGIHGLRVRKKRATFLKSIEEAENSVRRGFAVLRRDIAAELALVRKGKETGIWGDEEKAKEAELLKDTDSIERYIEKEIWEVEQKEAG